MRLAPGVFPSRKGFRAIVRVPVHGEKNGKLVSKRFPADTKLSVIKDWRLSTRLLWKTKPRPEKDDAPAPGTFAEDADTYLKAVKAMTTYNDRARDIGAWVSLFGEQPRSNLGAPVIAATLASWRSSLAASTVNHRRTALMHLWTTLDGAEKPNPVKAIPKQREPEAAPRGLSYAVIDAILSRMRDGKTKARLMVMAAVGIPPASLKRIRAQDVRLTERIVYVPGRLKGKGTKGRAVPLTEAGVLAFRLFVREDAFGAFDTSCLDRLFKSACRRVCDDGALDEVKAYDLRHSFGTLAYAKSGDIRATQLLLGHSSEKMTHRYTLAAVDVRMQAAILALDGGENVANRRGSQLPTGTKAQKRAKGSRPPEP